MTLKRSDFGADLLFGKVLPGGLGLHPLGLVLAA
jgi:hypothetical protein